jgi:hypothetical protein
VLELALAIEAGLGSGHHASDWFLSKLKLSKSAGFKVIKVLGYNRLLKCLGNVWCHLSNEPRYDNCLTLAVAVPNIKHAAMKNRGKPASFRPYASDMGDQRRGPRQNL